ncbi:hypothetical protein E8E13_005256 [Curvularia kusanoi]|uniref:Uncharacterized protein n=1 Tax=Curvularia kusanoi TaxID=90978 RepID=A0A9P4T8W2_CURKU|nr:hypothetical protein E8E13_005256 [Curvularia kusanoi]
MGRSSTPPPLEDVRVPATPGPSLPKATIPPSPDRPGFGSVGSVSKSKEKRKASPPAVTERSLTGRIQKSTRTTTSSVLDVLSVVDNASVEKKAISLMDMPGEIRNIIYSYACPNDRQALLVHRPRIASLRPRTQLDRNRPLRSDLVEREQARRVPEIGRDGRRRRESFTLERQSNRPFFGLTQVSRQLRAEFRPLYMHRQEVGMDMKDIDGYLTTFYSEAPELLNALVLPPSREDDLPFSGNVTIAIGDDIKASGDPSPGIDLLPFLDIWANSYKIEAGFGRYLQNSYNATMDGEAKDLYRLFGRLVQKDRQCSTMNIKWRTILRERSLASVRVYRKPAASVLVPYVWVRTLNSPSPVCMPQPYIHIIYRRGAGEPWMHGENSMIPDGWLEERGFGEMEYFKVKVGVESTARRSDNP